MRGSIFFSKSSAFDVELTQNSEMCSSEEEVDFSAQQRSTWTWAQARAVPSVSKDSQPWWINMSLCEIFGLLNMLSHCWGHLNTALIGQHLFGGIFQNSNTQHVKNFFEELYKVQWCKSSAFLNKVDAALRVDPKIPSHDESTWAFVKSSDCSTC